MIFIGSPLAMRARMSSFLAERSGSAAVEFGLIATVLLAILGGIIDLSFMIAANRDAERVSALIVKTLASCPPRTTLNEGLTHRGSDCVTTTMNLYTSNSTGRMKNIMVRSPDAELKLLYFTRVVDDIQTCYGSVDFVGELGADVETSVKSISRNDDTGVVAMVKTTYTPFVPKFITDYALSAGLNSRQYTADIQGSGAGSRCSRSAS